MKINFQFVTVLSAGANLVAASTTTCDTNDLDQPDHFKAWDCVPEAPSSGIVPAGTKCYLECQDGFIPYSEKRRNFYVCRQNGWRPKDPLPLTCRYDRK